MNLTEAIIELEKILKAPGEHDKKRDTAIKIAISALTAQLEVIPRLQYTKPISEGENGSKERYRALQWAADVREVIEVLKLHGFTPNGWKEKTPRDIWKE